MYIMYYMYNITIYASWADETISLSDAPRQQRLKVIKYSDKKHFQLLIVLDDRYRVKGLWIIWSLSLYRVHRARRSKKTRIGEANSVFLRSYANDSEQDRSAGA